ncbi:MAG: NAD-glutamate dehydrogenase [Caulobacterales bacterium]
MDGNRPLDRAFSRDELLRLAESAKYLGFQRDGRLTRDAVEFLAQLFEDAEPDELEGVSLQDFLAIAHAMWLDSETREPGAQSIVLRNAIGADGRAIERLSLEIVGPDMPFLVDSVMAEINAQSLRVLAMFHPIVSCPRTPDGRRANHGVDHAESYILVHLEPLDVEARRRVLEGVQATLADVRAAVSDYQAMRARMKECARALQTARTPASPGEVSEALDFLNWLADEHFAFLGVRDADYPRAPDGTLAQGEPNVVPHSSLGVLRDPNRGVLRRGSEPSVITASIGAFLDAPTPIVVSKSNLKSRVHRRVYADYIGVKRYDSDGMVIGETRFVGLFTAESYVRQPSEIPLLRRKVQRVLDQAGKQPGSHNAKALRNIVESYPRDELYQISEDELLNTCLGILHLQDRPRTRIFIRRDRFDRFASILVFVPRENYDSELREKIGAALARAYDGRVSAYYPNFSDGPLARVHFIIGGFYQGHPEPNEDALEDHIAAMARSWDDELAQAARDGLSNGEGADVAHAYAGAFSAGYREMFSPFDALTDIAELKRLTPEEPVRVGAYRVHGDGADVLRCKIYSSGELIALSAALPILENLGLYVVSETGYVVKPRYGAPGGKIHDVRTRSADGSPVAFDTVEQSFERAFAAAWSGRTENDGFNKLILSLGVDWREAALLRALAKYRGQSGLDPSQTVQEMALSDYPELARLILDLFHMRLDPDMDTDLSTRQKTAETVQGKINQALEKVVSLDHDRVLRRMAALVSAIQRTNFYQTDAKGAHKAHISFKVASSTLTDLPDPKPFREIFIWSPQVEGVHLRFGPVARGGLRWSDRRDDFRTEVLGLVKAQQVKNAVIVPVGSKGGFYPKQLPRGGNRDAIQTEAISAYKTFLRGLLDITDNLDGQKVTHPADTVVWDGEDPYLVVAADKGTATFSDIANGVAAEYGFWLGDAFASGGSQGYDHKAMGITAKGAWEAVKRHFREMVADIQAEPFTVIGVGDMSGDVFGNGMLLSKQIKLIAAFDHRDIFIDPNPDPATSWDERARLFALPRSSWQDYDPAKISQGGGIISRAAKSMALTPEMKAISGIEADSVTPAEFLHALLKAPCDLLWFGGIGTFIKARSQSHMDVGDKANDAVRVDADEVRAKVVGEGANLGVTQAGRIAFAQHKRDDNGGRINTDAIDNSAGVDTSDHEVNIKILLAGAIRSGSLQADDRNALLDSMRDEVGALVLRDNYDQTRALSFAQSSAEKDIDAHERFIQSLEKLGRLNRRVEGLPSTEEFKNRREAGVGLTRPELSVLLAYAKLTNSSLLQTSDVPDDPHFLPALKGYFPAECAKFEPEMQSHRLRREIITMRIGNALIDLGGPVLIQRVSDASGAAYDDIIRALEAVRKIFRLDEFMQSVEAIDGPQTAALQLGLQSEAVRVLGRESAWLAARLHAKTAPRPIGELIAAYQPGVDSLRAMVGASASPLVQADIVRRAQSFVSAGAPAELAQTAAGLQPLANALDILDLGRIRSWGPAETARVVFAAGEAFGFADMRAGADAAKADQHWDRLALRRLREELFSMQLDFAGAAMRHAESKNPQARSGVTDPNAAAHLIETWRQSHGARADIVKASLEDIRGSGAWTLGKLTLAAAQLRTLSGSAA